MKVACATRHMMEEFRDVYPEVFPLSEHLDQTDIDLLIFTGGADINPILYGENPDGTNSWDNKRDEDEMRIFNLWNDKILKVKKVLGVCRGIQMLNVMFGGSLYQDLGDVHLEHQFRHQIRWDEKSPLDFLETVNSLHHQAVRSIGRVDTAHVLAYEPKTGIPEVMMWGSNTLAVQFHPEFFGEGLKTKFFSIVNDWVDGKIEIMKKSRASGPKYSTTTVSSTFSDDTFRFINIDDVRRENRIAFDRAMEELRQRERMIEPEEMNQEREEEE